MNSATIAPGRGASGKEDRLLRGIMAGDMSQLKPKRPVFDPPKAYCGNGKERPFSERLDMFVEGLRREIKPPS